MRVKNIVVLFVGCLFKLASAQENDNEGCYDEAGKAQRCMTRFKNVAYELPVTASNTCGVRGPNEYCLKDPYTGQVKSCKFCNAKFPEEAHSPDHVTDLDSRKELTWWQSETMMEGITFPNTVNLTLDFEHPYELTYINIRFHSSRPESLVIYKKRRHDSGWEPFQFFSASCESTFNMGTDEAIRRGNEAKAICTADYSDISPLEGGTVTFSTLVGRPSAFDFQNSRELQEWVTASQIKIVLTRMNTFGDEVFNEPRVLKSYFYAISNLDVGGRCKCNGHAKECIRQTKKGSEDKLVCKCEHNTTGPECDQCLPLYNDRPWGRATAEDPHECLPCECNNLATVCRFIPDQFQRTGKGGYCINCRDDTAGAHCERCRDYYYRRAEDNRCINCGCSDIGSIDLQCDSQGKCQCKPGVTGDKCDRCQNKFFNVGRGRCRENVDLQAVPPLPSKRVTPDSGARTVRKESCTGSLLRPWVISLERDGLCDSSFKHCSHTIAKLHGNSPAANTDDLECRLRQVSVGENGPYETFGEIILAGMFLDCHKVFCHIPDPVASTVLVPHITGWHVAISNQNQEFGVEKLLLTYDGTCVSCQSGDLGPTCSWSNTHCFIDGKCVPDGAINWENPCMVCDVKTSIWSYHLSPGCEMEGECFPDGDVNPYNPCERCHVSGSRGEFKDSHIALKDGSELSCSKVCDTVVNHVPGYIAMVCQSPSVVTPGVFGAMCPVEDIGSLHSNMCPTVQDTFDKWVAMCTHGNAAAASKDITICSP